MGLSLSSISPKATHSNCQTFACEPAIANQATGCIDGNAMPRSMHGLQQVRQMVDVLEQVVDPYVNDPFSPRLFNSLKEKIAFLNHQILTSPFAVSNRLDGSLFDYFLKPMDQYVTINGQTCQPSLFLADILTLIAEIDQQKTAFQKMKQEFSIIPQEMKETEIQVNGQSVTVTNAFNGQAYESALPYDVAYDVNVPLVLLKDDLKNVNTLVSIDMFKGICQSSTKSHPITRTKLQEVACLLLSPINENVRACLGVQLPMRVCHRITASLSEDLGNTYWLKCSENTLIKEHYIKKGQTAETVCRTWLEEEGADPVNVKCRIRTEASRLKGQLSFDQQCIFLESDFNRRIQTSEMDPLKEILAAYLELIQIKAALHVILNEPQSHQPLHLWQLYQSLKMELNYV